MANLLTHVAVRNYRALASVDVDVGPLNVIFGPNGAGKSTFLDTLWFVRDCVKRGVDLAASERSHGIGVLWDGAKENDLISVTLATSAVAYEIALALSSGRIESFAGERLNSRILEKNLIERSTGSDTPRFFHVKLNQYLAVLLREPEKLSLSRYLDLDDAREEASDLERLIQYIHMYHSRSFELHTLKQRGSESSHQTWLFSRGTNLWSVLRNLQLARSKDDRYDTIVGFMAVAFPGFDGVELDQTGPTSVTGNLLEKGRRAPIRASGISDGHLQLLLLLTSLFSEGKGRDSLMLFDEPEISLHPHALAVFADAVKLATKSWNKQVFIATHSPVLISQFDVADILVATVNEGATELRRVSDIEGISDLLDRYAAGSLYMADVLGPQSGGPVAPPSGDQPDVLPEHE